MHYLFKNKADLQKFADKVNKEYGMKVYYLGYKKFPCVVDDDEFSDSRSVANERMFWLEPIKDI